VLVGRDTELATIGELIDGFDAQTPFVLGVGGPAGSGRSALLEQARRMASDAGATVLATRGSVDSVDIAFGGLLTLLRPWQNDLDALAGDLADPLRAAMAMRRDRVDPLDVRLAVFRVLTVAAEQQPVTVIVDDADQLDAATLDALRFAFGRLGVDRVGAIASWQGHDGPLDGVATHRLTLGPLSTEALASIVAQRLPCTADVAATCAVWANGSPLAAIDLARSFTDDERTGKAPLPPVPRPTARIVDHLQSELDALSEPARRAVMVAAADRSGSARVVAGALRALGEPTDGLDDAERAGVLDIDDDTVTFRHPLLRPLSYRLVAAASRRAAHRALANALVEPQQAAERAWQLVASCSGPDDEVAQLLDLVADDARRRGAAGDAAATLERAARISETAPARAERLRRAACAHLDALAFDDAARLAGEAAASGDREAALLLLEAEERRDGVIAALASATSRSTPLAVQIDLLLSAGRTEEARAAMRTLEATARDGVPSDERDLRSALRAAFDASAALAARADDDGDGALARRARRRWMLVAAARGEAPRAATTADELLAAARAAQVRGDRDAARAYLDRVTALLPADPGALGTGLDAQRAELEEPTPDPVLAALTPAERRVAEAVADGRTNREAASHLFLSVKTVDFHLQSVYRKLEVRSRTELAVRMARGGRS
jgi:DNA-binding CsgD family transcriptional regulator